MGAVRLFLALIVAADHFRAVKLAPWQLDLPWTLELGMNGGFAVMYFYMISGFLISLVLQRKYPPTARGTAAFYYNRFIRIFSLYWPVAVIYYLTVGHHSPIFGLNEATAFLLFGLDWFVAFSAYPEIHFESALPGFAQAWTLGAELTFYIFAPLLLRARLAFWITFVASILTRAWFVHATGGFDVRWTYLFAPSTFLFFLLGHLAYAAAGRFPWLQRGAIGLVCLVGCVAFLMLPTYSAWDSLRFWLATLCFAAALPGVFQATKDSRALNRMGDLSYPVYLLHVLVIIALGFAGFDQIVLRHLSGSPSLVGTEMTFLFLAIVTVVAWAAHWVLEKPMARAMRWSTDRIRMVPPLRPKAFVDRTL